VVNRQPDQFTTHVIDAMFDLVEDPGIVSILDVLRRLTGRHHDLAVRLVDAALNVLQHRRPEHVVELIDLRYADEGDCVRGFRPHLFAVSDRTC
jgi:hypothetical protein